MTLLHGALPLLQISGYRNGPPDGYFVHYILKLLTITEMKLKGIVLAYSAIGPEKYSLLANLAVLSVAEK